MKKKQSQNKNEYKNADSILNRISSTKKVKPQEPFFDDEGPKTLDDLAPTDPVVQNGEDMYETWIRRFWKDTWQFLKDKGLKK